VSRILAIVFFGFLFLASDAHAVLIGDFPGFDKLAAKADAVVILRVDHHVNVQSNPPHYTTYDCYIYQTLKGEIPGGKTIRLRLMDTRFSFVSPYAIHSTHLMFLANKRTPDELTEYRTIEFEGANIRVPPFGNEQMPEGDTIVERISSLLKRAIDYNQKTHDKERQFLERAIW
jgi:hypothetical protein